MTICGRRLVLQRKESVVGMYLDHNALMRLSRVLDNLDAGAILMDETGKVIYPEGDPRRLSLPEAVLGKTSVPVVYGGVTLIGISADDNGSGELIYLCISGDSRETGSIALLACELVRLILQTGSFGVDKDHALRRLLMGECNISETESVARQFGVPEQKQRCVMCIYMRGENKEKLNAVLEGFADDDGDAWTEIAPGMTALIKSLPEDGEYDSVITAAQRLSNAMAGEGLDAVIGVSDPVINISELPRGFKEARETVNVGGVYRPDEKLLIYRRIMLERFLYSVPYGAVSEYGTIIFNPSTARLFTEEMMHTIEVFFDSNLNLSEAARTLGIHRNTLVYRLEKVQKLTGFDLREFDDAVTFKLLMLLNRNSNAVKPRV